MRILILALALLFMPALAAAQPTMAVWVDEIGGLTNDYDIPIGLQFEVVVTLDSGVHQSSYAEWKMPDLVAYAGLVKIGESIPVGDCGFLPENCFQGEYRVSFTECEAPDERIQLARIIFADFTGTAVKDLVVTLGGPDGGDPGIIDCEELPIAAPMGGSRGGETSAGVTYPDGSLILNPTRPLPNDADSFGVLKSRY